MKPCPFCGEKIERKHPVWGVHYNNLCEKWIFDHTCHIGTTQVDVTTTVYGDTEEEAVERWNRRAEIQKSESL